MTRKMRLSDRAVSRLGAALNEYTVWDTRITGFGVRVRPSGHRSFIVLNNRNGSSKRRTLGPVTRMTVEEARSRCLAIQSGDREVLTDSPTVPVPLFGDFVANAWRSECFDHFKPSTRRSADHVLTRQLLPVFGDLAIDRIRRKEVTAWFDLYSGVAPTGANRLSTRCIRFSNTRKFMAISTPTRQIVFAGIRNANSTGSCPGRRPVVCMPSLTDWLLNVRSERRMRISSACSTTRDAVTVRSGLSSGAKSAPTLSTSWTAKQVRERYI